MKSLRKWNQLGYKVRKGERSYRRSYIYGIPLFARHQVVRVRYSYYCGCSCCGC